MKQLFLLVLSVFFFSSCSTNQEQSTENDGKSNYNKIERKYDITLFDEEVNEMGVIKAQIAQRIYFGKIDSSLSNNEIELYLNERLRKLDVRKGFKNFNNASHLMIWLHASKDHAVEGGGNWIAMISKFGEENNVKFSVSNKDKLNYFKNPTNSVINNLSEEVRREIYIARTYAGDKAINEANLKFPDGNDWEENYDLNIQLQEKYYKKLYKHYSIREDISNEIFTEGFKKGWLVETGQTSFKL